MARDYARRKLDGPHIEYGWHEILNSAPFIRNGILLFHRLSRSACHCLCILRPSAQSLSLGEERGAMGDVVPLYRWMASFRVRAGQRHMALHMASIKCMRESIKKRLRHST